MEYYLYIYVLGLLLFLAVGLFTKKSPDYYQGSRDYNSFSTTAGIIASFIGGGSIINLIELSNQYGYWALADVIPSSLGLLFAAYFVSRKYSNTFFKNNIYNSQPAYVFHHSIILFLYILVMTAQFIGIGKLLSMSGIENTHFLIIATACVILIYSFKGYNAVVNTDKIQFLILLTCFYLLLLVTNIFFPESKEANSLVSIENTKMPLSLVISLSLPFFFIPISQELHQRSSASVNQNVLRKSFAVSGILYFILGGLVVYTSSSASSGLEGIIGLMPHHSLRILMFFAVMTALVSTIDTALNIANHSLSSIIGKEKLQNEKVLLSIPILGCVLLLSTQFPSILSVILLALFVYMSGPAFIVVAKNTGLTQRKTLIFSGVSILIHIVFKLLLESPLSFSLLIILIQYVGILFIGTKKP